METQISMPDMLQFYAGLAEHNEKKWFDERKALYLAIKSYYETLGMDIYAGLKKFDPDLGEIGPKDITWRIYQDQRFHDRPPYKSWCGLYFAKGGRKSHYPGYYLHIEPGANEFFLCAGIWRQEKLIIKSVREEIMLNGEQFAHVATPGHGWSVMWDGALARPAQGWLSPGTPPPDARGLSTPTTSCVRTLPPESSRTSVPSSPSSAISTVPWITRSRSGCRNDVRKTYSVAERTVTTPSFTVKRTFRPTKKRPYSRPGSSRYWGRGSQVRICFSCDTSS